MVTTQYMQCMINILFSITNSEETEIHVMDTETEDILETGFIYIQMMIPFIS